MAQPTRSTVNNRLLQSLVRDDFALLQPHLQVEQTEPLQVLIARNAIVHRLYFPENGVVSTVFGSGSAEVCLIGRDGLVGIAAHLLGDGRSPCNEIVNVPGDVIAIDAQALRAAAHESAPLRVLLLRYVQTLMIQAFGTAYVNAAKRLAVRLARLLLMYQDRADGDMALTHQFIARTLSAQRTSVTLALQSLEELGLIRARRGRIQIRDRNRLIEFVGEAYGLPEAEYARLIEAGRPLARSASAGE